MNLLAASVLAAGELVCEFRGPYEHNLLADLTREPQRAGQMLVYEALGADSARVFSSSVAGRKSVRVVPTEKAVHLIEPVAASVRVTTLTHCERWRTKQGVEVCMRFAARHAWHFDALAYSDPDAAFARLPSGASAGFCEPWAVD